MSDLIERVARKLVSEMLTVAHEGPPEPGYVDDTDLSDFYIDECLDVRVLAHAAIREVLAAMREWSEEDVHPDELEDPDFFNQGLSAFAREHGIEP